MAPTKAEALAAHEFDDDGCCVRCGFDASEWSWWRYATREGMAMKTPMPHCVMDAYEQTDRQADCCDLERL